MHILVRRHRRPRFPTLPCLTSSLVFDSREYLGRSAVRSKVATCSEAAQLLYAACQDLLVPQGSPEGPVCLGRLESGRPLRSASASCGRQDRGLEGPEVG